MLVLYSSINAQRMMQVYNYLLYVKSFCLAIESSVSYFIGYWKFCQIFQHKFITLLDTKAISFEKYRFIRCVRIFHLDEVSLSYWNNPFISIFPPHKPLAKEGFAKSCHSVGFCMLSHLDSVLWFTSISFGCLVSASVVNFSNWVAYFFSFSLFRTTLLSSPEFRSMILPCLGLYVSIFFFLSSYSRLLACTLFYTFSFPQIYYPFILFLLLCPLFFRSCIVIVFSTPLSVIY